MSISISANNGIMNVPSQNFLFGKVVAENPNIKQADNNAAYSVSISREGLEKLNASKVSNSMGVQKVNEYKDILSKSQIDVTGTIEADFHRKYTNLNGKDRNDLDGDLSAEQFAKNALSTYADMYDEIKRGYAEGTREIYIADGSSEYGYRRATEEDEIKALDSAFDFHASYTEAYTRFVNEDRDILSASIQNTRDSMDSQKARAMAKQEEYWDEQHRLNEEDKEKFNHTSMDLADSMRQARDFLKIQYRNLSGNVENLLEEVFKNMQLSAN